jgi:SAM-dependent methyltransferase
VQRSRALGIQGAKIMTCQAIRLLSLFVVLVLGLTPVASSQDIGPLAPAGAPANLFPTPDRPIAEIISPIWATEEERDAVGESSQIIRLLGLTSGMSVADIGAGSGYHTVRLSRALGPESRVYAQDVMPDYLTDLQKRVQAEGLDNVTVSSGEPHDPRLATASLDAAVLVHMYHEIAQPFALLYNLAPALKPGAHVGIVDLDRPTWEHGTPKALLRCELAAVGYEQIGFSELTGNVGYLAVFKPPIATRRVPPHSITPCRVQQR